MRYKDLRNFSAQNMSVPVMIFASISYPFSYAYKVGESSGQLNHFLQFIDPNRPDQRLYRQGTFEEKLAFHSF